jgi:hypothetical protein
MIHLKLGKTAVFYYPILKNINLKLYPVNCFLYPQRHVKVEQFLSIPLIF